LVNKIIVLFREIAQFDKLIECRGSCQKGTRSPLVFCTHGCN